MTGPRADSHAEGGTLGAGRYILGEILGEGGMATVFRARDTRLGVTRAIKLLTPGLTGKRRIEQRFENEARAMASLAHPAIVRVIDIAEDDGRPYIVMELLEGGTLWEWVETHGPMPERMALDALLPVIDAMEAAHAKGIIHRDLKPQNILLSSTGESRVTDFGIAHVTDPRGDNLTRTGTVMGTWGYMSPEQRNSARSVDPRSDVYAIGATLAALVTARVPIDLFAADQDPALLRGVSSSLATVIQRATQYGPDGRFQSAAEMGEAMSGVREQLETTPPDTPPLGLRHTAGVTAVPFEPDAPERTTGTLAEFAPITTDRVAQSGAPEPAPPKLGADLQETLGDAPRAPSRVPAFLLALAAGAALVGIASWAAIRYQPPAAGDEPSAIVAPELTSPPRAQPTTPAPTPNGGSKVEPQPVTTAATGPGEAERPRDLTADPSPAPDASPPTDGDATPATDTVDRTLAPDTGPAAAGTVLDGAGDAAEARPEVVAPQPAMARVIASGDAEEVWLVTETARVDLGLVPEGSYTVMARFAGGDAAPAGRVELTPGDGVRLDCVTAFHKCKAYR